MITTNLENLKNELLDIVKIFYPTNYDTVDIKHVFGGEGGEYIDFFNICNAEYSIKHQFAEYYANYSNFRVLKRIIKADLYKILSKITNKTSPWGSLTGIRPVKLYKDTFIELDAKTDEYFTDFFSVSKEKLALIKDIAKVQQKLPALDEKDCDLYIGIPFCNGRCSYCSFVSADINKNTDLIEPYINALVNEIKSLKNLIIKSEYKIRAIYIGGGTPSSFSIKNLKRIFEALKDFNPIEHTFEAGRPDSITKELLNLLNAYGVNRISINPQTANDGTLKRIGRNHVFADVLNAYELTAKEYNFIINMDVIAGFAGEAFEDFKNTLDRVIILNPDNITLHTLCLKKGSASKIDLEKQKDSFKNLGAMSSVKNDMNTEAGEEVKLRENAKRYKLDSSEPIEVSKMLNYAHTTLKKSGYEPYYLYRQKYSAGNLENTGYCKIDKICLYNIDNMDDTASILACGANGISKRVYSDGRIERYANPKDIRTYIEKINTINLKKNELFEK